MKLVVVCLLSVAAVVLARPQQPQQPQQEPVPILKQASDISPEGAYQFSYETGNGIKAEEVGSLAPADNPEDGNVVFAEGSYSYTGDDGVVYTVTYKADKNGYQASGDHLPKK
ncbi:endocuticle structural glycoprotein SgAbd-4-like [Bacillus rossius redtenbacheri]|uniref:endocuticle structural glycoprotein SgAbd-4-like n=1 Tax=Bacillus rossius redtenbacheri TaxID=93214 RepID=UPI002FDECF7C